MKKSMVLLGLAILPWLGCNSPQKQANTNEELPTGSGLYASNFTDTINGEVSSLFVLKNASGMEVCISNYGARIVSILVPDKEGKGQDVVLGFDKLSDFRQYDNNFGSAIGRYGNRIAKGSFTLDGETYTLPQNNGENTLHGGPEGFDKKHFEIQNLDKNSLVCTYLSPDGEAGFPGNLEVSITYTLTEDNALRINYWAKTDKPTVVNLTNHSYFNLSGNPTNEITDHILYIHADRYTPVNEDLIPTGKLEPVQNTPLDFTQAKTVADGIDSDFQQIQYGRGFDHNWVLHADNTPETVACRLVCPSTGIVLEVFTSEPAVQFYSGNFLDGTQTGKNGVVYNKRSALCLETQHYPDSPNQAQFPSTILRPGEEYASLCIYKFGIE